MINDLKHLPAMLASAPCSLLAWMRLAGAAGLTLVVVGLEIWLRVPVRPVIDQLLGFQRPAPARAI
jgi:hypothetical protein